MGSRSAYFFPLLVPAECRAYLSLEDPRMLRVPSAESLQDEKGRREMAQGQALHGGQESPPRPPLPRRPPGMPAAHHHPCRWAPGAPPSTSRPLNRPKPALPRNGRAVFLQSPGAVVPWCDVRSVSSCWARGTYLLFPWAPCFWRSCYVSLGCLAGDAGGTCGPVTATP